MGLSLVKRHFTCLGGRPANYDKDFQYASSILTDKKHKDKHPWCNFNKTIKVPITTIDHFCEQKGLDRINFLWMDVQGAEGEVLKGATKMLSKIHYIYAECIDAEYYEGEWSFNQMNDFFKQKGWSLVERYAEDVLFKNDELFAKNPIKEFMQ